MEDVFVNRTFARLRRGARRKSEASGRCFHSRGFDDHAVQFARPGSPETGFDAREAPDF